MRQTLGPEMNIVYQPDNDDKEKENYRKQKLFLMVPTNLWREMNIVYQPDNDDKEKENYQKQKLFLMIPTNLFSCSNDISLVEKITTKM